MYIVHAKWFDSLEQKDLTNKFQQIHKENTAPNQVSKIQKTNSRTILNNNDLKRANIRHSPQNNATTSATSATSIPKAKNKRMSMTDVSDMLQQFYRANAAAKVPKFQATQQQQIVMATAATAAAVKYINQTSPTSAETNEPSTIAAIATNGSASDTASKNLPSDEMMTSKLAASFHRSIKYPEPSNKVPSPEQNSESTAPIMTAIPTSVVVPAKMPSAEPLDIKPLINPRTGLIITPHSSVIKPVPVANTIASPEAAAIAAALICDGYHNFQQQLRKFQKVKVNPNVKVEESPATNILETFLRQQKNPERDNDTASDTNAEDTNDEDDSRYSGFDDIHLVEGNRTQFPQLLQNVMANTSSPGPSGSVDYYSDEPQKYMNLAAQAQAQAQALRNLDFSFGDYGSPNANDNSNSGPTAIGPDGEPVYECRHCGKKYRWKSTLRRHENVECGGKEPSHKCPYCTYKSKQRGNLGVHVRKHHADLPQLESKRRSKYSVKFEQNSSIKLESNSSCNNASDDSNSKLIIDCSK